MLEDIKNYSFRRAFIRGEFFSISWESLERLASAINVFLMLKFLNLYEFGVYQLLLSFFSIVSVFSIDSIHEVVNNDLSRSLKEKQLETHKKIFSEYLSLRIILGLITTLVVFIFADIISVHYGQSIEAYLKIISILFLVEGLRRPLFAALKTRLYFGVASSQAAIVSATKFLIFLLLLATQNFNLFWIMTAHVSGYIVSGAIMLIFFLVKIKDSFTAAVFAQGSVLWSIVKRHGKWAIAGEQISRFTLNVRPWLIKFLLNTEAVAVFSLATSLAGMLTTFLPVRTFSSLIPRELGDKQRLRLIYANGVKFIGLLGLLLAGAAFLIFPPIINFFLPRYTASFPYFKLLVFVFLTITGFTTLTRTTLVALREQRALFTRPLLQLLPTVAFSFILIPPFGLWGAALEYTLTLFFLYYILYRYLCRVRPELKLKPAEIFSLRQSDRQFLKDNLNPIFFELKNKVKKRLRL
jgi:O-antigen/teichoic acid export membrane protein